MHKLTESFFVAKETVLGVSPKLKASSICDNDTDVKENGFGVLYGCKRKKGYLEELGAWINREAKCKL